MTKEEYLRQLKKALKGLEKEDRQKTLDYYTEMIDDAVEDGKTETQAVAMMDEVNDVVERLLSETEIKPRKKKVNGWVITLLVLGFPLWFSLLVAVGSCVLALYISVWAVIISLAAVVVALCAAIIVGFVTFFFLLSVNLPSGLFILGASLICAAIGVALAYPAFLMVVGFARLTGKTFNSVVKKITRKA